MRKLLFVFAIAVASYACGGGSTESNTPVSNNEDNKNSQIGGESSTTADTKTPSATSTPTGDSATSAAAVTSTANTSVAEGKALIEKSDCRTCHQDATKVIGPAYMDVAKKYKATDANVKMLAGKVIAGGKGVWGEIPMTPHPQISQADAESMVRYVLSMKKS